MVTVTAFASNRGLLERFAVPLLLRPQPRVVGRLGRSSRPVARLVSAQALAASAPTGKA
jgi:hypothetical protein